MRIKPNSFNALKKNSIYTLHATVFGGMHLKAEHNQQFREEGKGLLTTY